MATHQVFIASYHKDWCWLIHCLTSLKKFSSGFLHPVVGVHFDDWAGAKEIVAQSYPEARVVVYDGVEGQGFLRAQLMMMGCDVFCPDADFTWLLGSDCLVTAPFSPEPYFRDGKPVMLYSLYSEIEKHHPQALPWKHGTAVALGYEPHAEFMRRLPLIYPRELFAPMRQHIAALHGKTFLKYIEGRGRIKPFDTSESNIMGAFAWKWMNHLYHWVEITDWEKIMKEYPNATVQFWSHHKDGLDGVCDHNAILPSGRGTAGRTPRSIINEVLYGL